MRVSQATYGVCFVLTSFIALIITGLMTGLCLVRLPASSTLQYPLIDGGFLSVLSIRGLSNER